MGSCLTFAVVGVYCSSSSTSFLKTTAPGDAAMFSPFTKGVASTIVGMPLLNRISCSLFCQPLRMLLPPVSKASLMASGLVQKKLVGAMALVRMSIANLARSWLRQLPSLESILSMDLESAR